MADEEGNCTTFVCNDYDGIYFSYIYLHTFILLAGITLNILSFIIFFRESNHFRHFGPFLVFVRHLCISDLTSLTFTVPLGFCRCYEIQTDVAVDFCNVYMTYIMMPFCNGFYAVSVWITVTMTLERYVLIKQFKICNSREVTSKFINIIVMCFYIFSAVLHLPYFFYKEIEGDTVVVTEFAMTQGYDIWSWTRAVLARYLPIALIISFNIAITIELWLARKRRIAMMNKSMKMAKKPKFTKSVPLLLGVSTTFVLCNSVEPMVYFDIYGPCKYDSFSYQLVVLMINLLESSAASTNFIFYAGFNRRFRQVLCHLFPMCASGKSRVSPESKTAASDSQNQSAITAVS